MAQGALIDTSLPLKRLARPVRGSVRLNGWAKHARNERDIVGQAVEVRYEKCGETPAALERAAWDQGGFCCVARFRPPVEWILRDATIIFLSAGKIYSNDTA